MCSKQIQCRYDILFIYLFLIESLPKWSQNINILYSDDLEVFTFKWTYEDHGTKKDGDYIKYINAIQLQSSFIHL